jgi:hypothetical protein
LKAPIKRMEFERAVKKRVLWSLENGINAYDPAVLQLIKVDAYKDANRAIFMQDNLIADNINQFLSVKYSKETGKATPGSLALHAVGKTLLPIVRVPSNLVAEAFTYALGLETGSLRLANAFREGIENLKPEQADLIMRELKKGSVGKAVLITGYLTAKALGGLYDPSIKKEKGAVKEGEIRTPLGDIPKLYLHHPLVEVAMIGATVYYDLHQPIRIPKTHKGMLTAMQKPQEGMEDAVEKVIFDLVREVPLATEAVTSAELLNPRTRQRAEGDLVKSILVPQAIDWLARVTDKDLKGETVKRKATTISEHVKEGIPGLRETLPVKK